MPTTNMARVETIVTGVPGAPYYIRGHFDALDSDPDDMIAAWHTFNTGGVGATTTNFPTGASIVTSGVINLVDPATDSVVGVLSGSSISSGGTGTSPLAPLASQVLTNWRTGIYVGGREVRGKHFRPLITENVVADNGTLDATAAVAYRALAIALIDNADTRFVVYSKKQGRWEVVNNATIWQQLAVMRSRRD